MWQRTKQMINSYLDSLIDRTSRPESELRDVTRAEVARLNEVEAGSRAAAKMIEKQLAEAELKLTGATERQRMARERGDATGEADAASVAARFQQECDMLKGQLSEANASIARAQALKVDRRTAVNDLAAQTHLSSMQETLAGIQSPFEASDPSGVIDEMRSKIRRNAAPPSAVEQAGADLAAQLKKSKVDDLLEQYKKSLDQGGIDSPPETRSFLAPPATAAQQNASETSGAPVEQDAPQTETDEAKTLGPASGPVRPID
jgi:hypothetical protein